MFKVLVLGGKKIKLRERNSAENMSAKLSGRKLLVSPRKELQEIDGLKKKIEDLEKKIEYKSQKTPVKIEVKKEEPREFSPEDIRRIIKEELSVLPRERGVKISYKEPAEVPQQIVLGRKRVRIKSLEPLQETTNFIGQKTTQASNLIEQNRAKIGIEIPEIPSEKYEEEKRFNPSDVSMTYPLIPRNPKPGERVYAYASIYFDKARGEMIYSITEPKLDEKGKILLEEIKDYIQEKIDVNFGFIKRDDATNYIINIFDKAIRFLRIKTDPKILDDIRYYTIRDFIGLEKIEPLIQDSQIEDISCDGTGIPIFIYHRNNKIGSVKTNISFDDKEFLDSFVNKLAERCGKSISVAKPLLDGSLPDGSRIQATLGSDIARHGSNFTIRMFTEEPLTPIDIIRSGMCDLKTMAVIWFAVEYQSSILISGGTATGKTSLLNAFSLFIKPQMKIISIEDTAELRLPHSHWIPEVARASIAIGHEVDMFELLRESLRQRPDYIIVGEVRGREAYVLFQQMATGHAGFSTIHADSFQKLIDRLVTPPIELPPNLLENLDLVIFIRRIKQENKYKRRIDSIEEVNGFDQEKKIPIVNEIIKWEPSKDAFISPNKSMVLRKISEKANMTERDVQEEIKRRAQVLEWLVKKNVKDYRKVSSAINLYYLSPEFLMKKMGI